MPWETVIQKVCDKCDLPSIDPSIADGSMFRCDKCKTRHIVYTTVWTNKRIFIRDDYKELASSVYNIY